jgi:hypothetical protein
MTGRKLRSDINFVDCLVSHSIAGRLLFREGVPSCGFAGDASNCRRPGESDHHPSWEHPVARCADWEPLGPICVIIRHIFKGFEMSRQKFIDQILEACTLANGPKFLLTVERPAVNLADVLLALESSGRDDHVAVLQDGRFAKYNKGELLIYPKACWNLRSNYLDEQSGETLELIARLLAR